MTDTLIEAVINSILPPAGNKPALVKTNVGDFKCWPRQRDGNANPAWSVLANTAPGTTLRLQYWEQQSTSADGRVFNNRNVTSASHIDTQGAQTTMIDASQTQVAPTPPPPPAQPQATQAARRDTPIDVQALAKSYLEGGHTGSILRALSLAEQALMAFEAGERDLPTLQDDSVPY